LVIASIPPSLYVNTQNLLSKGFTFTAKKLGDKFDEKDLKRSSKNEKVSGGIRPSRPPPG